jgi:hypothetical protein
MGTFSWPPTIVNGQEILPVGGQQTCPPMVSRIAH